MKHVRGVTNTNINEMHEAVDNKIKTMAWNSHARQTKALEACAKLKREFDETSSEHVTSETELRHANNKLETEISAMITEYNFVYIPKRKKFCLFTITQPQNLTNYISIYRSFSN